MRYVQAGRGPVLVLVHGVLGSRRTWNGLVADLARDHRVIAPDLFGHGESAKPTGDYSLGAYAGTLRDLLDELGVGRATLVGHSFGGGVAMQFGYLFPDRVHALVLVSSGGLGRELSVMIRSAALPGAGLATVRSVVDAGGQTVTAQDRLYLMRDLPTLLVWGARDRIIPVSHARAAQREIPGSRLEVFPQAGHFPQLADPRRFAAVLRDFMASSTTRGGRPARRTAATSPAERQG